MAHGDGGTKIKTQPHISPNTVPIATSIGPCIILLVKLPINHTKITYIKIKITFIISLFYTNMKLLKNVSLTAH